MKSERLPIIGITGTPGTGKKSTGRIVAQLLGYRFLELNRVAFETGSILDSREEDFEVDPKQLRRNILKRIEGGGIVLSGHLLPYILKRGEADFVAVLRCSPEELEKRYVGRGYSEAKVKENIASEILDICLGDALKQFGTNRVAEFDTTGQHAEDVARDVVAVFKGLKPRSLGQVRWLSDQSAAHLIDRYLR
ncbi:MAG: adenylate kinase family protein [Thaumarchaeota archaeon]|nr:adenylate kinase family protein [Nitrososphaerota archaeon]MCL5317892.1 adenylate kinase family protein [Nitrososphaerota archaeon]